MDSQSGILGSPRSLANISHCFDLLYIFHALSVVADDHTETVKIIKKELSCFPILNYYSHLLWTHGLLFAPGSQGAGILLITKVAFYLATRYHPSHPCNTLSPLSSPSMFLHCFILYSILKILFDSVSLQQLPHFFVLWNKSSQKSCLYHFFLHSLIRIHLENFYFLLGNKFYFLVINFPSLEAKIIMFLA